MGGADEALSVSRHPVAEAVSRPVEEGSEDRRRERNAAAHRWAAGLAIAAMFASMLVFGANFALSRHAVQHGLTAYDLVFLRFGISGPLLLPLFLRAGRGIRDCAGVGWGRGLVLAATSGAPITLLLSAGVSLAPAAHGSALGPGTVTVVGVVYAIVMAGALPRWPIRIGLALALSGLIAIAAAGSASGSRAIVLGDLCFFATGLLWGFYPVLLHRWRVGAIVGAAICSVVSLAYLPVYLALLEPRLLAAPVGIILFQAVYQGLLVSILALWLWGHAVRVLGAEGTQLFPPLIPVIGTLIAIPILDEWPGAFQAVGIALIVSGLALSAWSGRSRGTSAAGEPAAAVEERVRG